MKTSIRFYNDRKVRAVWDEVVSVVLMLLVVLISSVVSTSSTTDLASSITVPSVPELVEGTIATPVEGTATRHHYKI